MLSSLQHNPMGPDAAFIYAAGDTLTAPERFPAGCDIGVFAEHFSLLHSPAYTQWAGAASTHTASFHWATTPGGFATAVTHLVSFLWMDRIVRLTERVELPVCCSFRERGFRRGF